MSVKYLKTQRHYATLYGRALRTIADYQALGAPLDNPAEMQAWMAQRAKGNRQPEIDLPEVEESAVDAMAKGAAEALRRLEAAEAKGAAVVAQAEASGDPAQIEAAQRKWYRACRELRYFDTSVELDRRDGGEKLSKEEAITALKTFAYQVSATLYDTIDAALGESDPRRAAIRQVIVDHLSNKLPEFKHHWPDWAIAPIEKALALQDEPADDGQELYPWDPEGKIKWHKDESGNWVRKDGE